MKRAFYEWGAITASSVAITCFVYWMASLATTFVDFELFLPMGHWKSTQILASNGTLTINDHRFSLETIEEVLKYAIVHPPLTSKAHWTLPGFTYRSINWGGQLTWSLSLSLWIPTFLFTLAAAFFIRRYVRVRRQALQDFQNLMSKI
jgi:hypothetical protein